MENDLQTAISNDPTWVSEMKSKVTGTDNRELRKQRISEAAQNAEISLRSAYENLQNALSQYEAAESAYSAAKQAWDTVQKKQAAGMLSKNAYLSGQASWLSGEAAMNTAKLTLSPPTRRMYGRLPELRQVHPAALRRQRDLPAAGRLRKDREVREISSSAPAIFLPSR